MVVRQIHHVPEIYRKGAGVESEIQLSVLHRDREKSPNMSLPGLSELQGFVRPLSRILEVTKGGGALYLLETLFVFFPLLTRDLESLSLRGWD